MADAPAQHSAPPPATVADVMHPPVTTVEQNDHVAGAAYMMKRAGATALVVTQARTREPVGIITPRPTFLTWSRTGRTRTTSGFSS